MAGGGRRGNTNALKHGLYAKQFNETQQTGLKKMAWDDQRHEINVARVAGSEVYKELQKVLSTYPIDLDQVVSLTYALMAAILATGTAARTHSLLNGVDEAVGDALSEALGNVPFDLVDDGETF